MARLFCYEMAEPKDFRIGCEFYLSVALKAANDLRGALRIDEESFRRTGPALWQDPRPAFIYRVLDEVQKAGVSIKDWSEKLRQNERKPEHTDHLIRLVTQWQQDEQRFRARKLSEILIELICFSQTNEAEYYRDYLRLKELDAAVQSLRDQQEFFGFRRRNTEYHVDWIQRDIRSAEKNGIDVSKRWYLKQPTSFQNKWKTSGLQFSSFRQRYIRILDIALPSELAIIGKSYVHAYNMSSDVHFTPHDISSNFNPDDIYLGIDRVGLLCYAILIRCQLLVGLVPAGINMQIRKMHEENAEPARLVTGLKHQIAEVGDFIWAHGDICRVKEIRKSKYGYTNYLVQYVERPPIPEIKQDYFAGGEIRLIAKKTYGERALTQLQNDLSLDKKVRDHFSNMPEERRDELIDQAVAKVWRLQQQILAESLIKKSDATRS
ncbi:MAG: hypothetical protein WA183_09795 [Chthoniobacterales bacterium]